MTLKIDKAGRIVLPKQLRRQWGLRAGMDLEVMESAEGLLLKPVTDKPAMIQINGFWVHQGEAPADFDWDRFLEQQREERIRQLSGL